MTKSPVVNRPKADVIQFYFNEVWIRLYVVMEINDVDWSGVGKVVSAAE